MILNKSVTSFISNTFKLHSKPENYCFKWWPECILVWTNWRKHRKPLSLSYLYPIPTAFQFPFNISHLYAHTHTVLDSSWRVRTLSHSQRLTCSDWLPAETPANGFAGCRWQHSALQFHPHGLNPHCSGHQDRQGWGRFGISFSLLSFSLLVSEAF